MLEKLHNYKAFSLHTVWCADHSGRIYGFDEYIDSVKAFHGHVAPGLLIGGKMVHTALKNMHEDVIFDALCETGKCLPDAVQMLTPCTIGNGWLKIEPFMKFALTLYDKYNGVGLRVFLDAPKLEQWPEIKSWFYKLKPKKEQNKDKLFLEIQNAGDSILSMRSVRIAPDYLQKQPIGERSLCSICNEAYPKEHGPICRACQGHSPYEDHFIARANEL